MRERNLLLGWTPKQWAIVCGWDGGPLKTFDHAASMQARWQARFLHEPDETPTILSTTNNDLRNMDWEKALEGFKLLTAEVRKHMRPLPPATLAFRKIL